MNLHEIALIRLHSQQITKQKFTKAQDLVGWMGAMQAQDPAMVKWAIGVRLPQTTEQAVEAAINNGEIIRTHLLRPTWHIVSAEDIYWMLELTAPQIKTSMKSRHRELGLTEAVIAQTNTIIEKALQGGKHLPRETLIAEFQKAGIKTGDNRASHLFARAELDGLVCSGALKGGKHTFALLEEWVPNKKLLTREEALATLANKYFTSHCPATLQDFVWWSGLSVSDAKLALGAVQTDFVSEIVEDQTYWLPRNFSPPAAKGKQVYLLPAFDEFIISYKDRSASLPSENHRKTVSNNGIFWPILVVNGQVKGKWKRTIKKDKVVVEIMPFEPLRETTKDFIEDASRRYGNFLEKEYELIIPD